MKHITLKFFIVFGFLHIYLASSGQKSDFGWIKPSKADSKNYKLARKLYRASSYEAGYFTMDYKLAKKLFKGKSAIAIESIPTTELLAVPLWQSDVYKNKLELDKLSGTITSVKKRGALFKEAKANSMYWKNLKMLKDKIEIPLRPKNFSVATLSDTKDTIRNLVIIRKKEICKIQPFRNFDGGLFLTPFPEIPFQFSRKYRAVEEQITTFIDQDTILFRLYYERGKTALSKEEAMVFQDQISAIEGTVYAIDVTGYASVEGNYEVNSALYKNRGTNIENELKVQLQPELEFNAHATENWELFKRQIDGTEYAYLAAYTKENVRTFVNENLDDVLIEDMLEEQRYVEVKLFIQREIEVEEIPDSPLAYYTKLIDQIKDADFRVGQSTLSKLEDAQIEVYTRYLRGDYTWEEIDQLEISEHPSLKAIRFNRLVLDYLSGKSAHTAKWFFDQFILMGAERRTSSSLKKAIRFNSQLLLYKAVQKGSLSYFLDLDQLHLKAYRDYIFKLIPTSTSKAKSKELDERLVLANLPRFINEFKGSRLNQQEVERLYRFYYTQMISSYYYIFYPETKRKAYRQLRGIYTYFSEGKLSSNEARLSVARLYMLFQKWDIAIATLSPLLSEPEFVTYASQLTLSCKQYTLHYEELIEEILSSRFDLGYERWIEMFENPYILGPRYFDNARIREYYYSR